MHLDAFQATWCREEGGKPNRCDSHGNVKLLLWATRLFTVYSQCNQPFTISPSILLFANNSHAWYFTIQNAISLVTPIQAKGRWFRIYENVGPQIDSNDDCLSLFDAVGCLRSNKLLPASVCLLQWPSYEQNCVPLQKPLSNQKYRAWKQREHR